MKVGILAFLLVFLISGFISCQVRVRPPHGTVIIGPGPHYEDNSSDDDSSDDGHSHDHKKRRF